MSLKKKIAISFFVSSFIIAILMAYEYVNFIRIRDEMRHLEITDTIRSKSLQLRRHEKNFFLYGPMKAPEEVKAVHDYLGELELISDGKRHIDKKGQLSELKKQIRDYREHFQKIESSYKTIAYEVEKVAAPQLRSRQSLSLLELAILEQPLQGVDFLEKELLLPSNHKLITQLKSHDAEIMALRKNGEEILNISKELDKSAREKAEGVIRISQIAFFIFFPLFLLVGIVTLFFITNNVVKQLRLLIGVIEKTGEGHYDHMSVPERRWDRNDEVGLLIQKFNDMEDQLSQREKELIQSKKLAAIGTLASGVAHELNNPLNNIYISAQVLSKEAGDSSLPAVKETIYDILSQTMRVKKIVGDLLEFARGREPDMRETDMSEIILGAYKLVSTATDTGRINFSFDPGAAPLIITADSEQIERVFINLFTNAIDAMNGAGTLNITASAKKDTAKISISDTGRGMTHDAVEKIFEPFYTTRDKGTGLGLAIVFNIIKKHHGEIYAESEEGKGTIFTITLPLKKGRS